MILSNIYNLCTSSYTLLLSVLLVSLGCIGNISSHYALSQVEVGTGGTVFMPQSVSGLTIQIPQNWTTNYRTNAFNEPVVSFCPDAGCHGYRIQVTSTAVTPGTILTSDVVLGLERAFQLQNIQIQTKTPVAFATTVFTGNSGQDLMGAGVIIIANGHLYVVHFLSTKESLNAFFPIIGYVTSHLLNDPNNVAGMERTIQDRSTADIIAYCTNMEIIANMHVGSFVEHWDPVCHQYD